MAAKVTRTSPAPARRTRSSCATRRSCASRWARGWDSAALYAEEKLSDDGAWAPLYDDEGNRISIAVAASRVVRLDERIFQHARAVRFLSSNSQGGTRTLTIQTERITALIHGVPA